MNIQFTSGAPIDNGESNPGTGGNTGGGNNGGNGNGSGTQEPVNGNKPAAAGNPSVASPNASKDQGSNSNLGLIIGVVIGAAVLAVIGILIFRNRVAKRKQRDIDAIIFTNSNGGSGSARGMTQESSSQGGFLGKLFKSGSSTGTSDSAVHSFKVLPPRNPTAASASSNASPSVVASEGVSSGYMRPDYGYATQNQQQQYDQYYSQDQDLYNQPYSGPESTMVSSHDQQYGYSDQSQYYADGQGHYNAYNGYEGGQTLGQNLNDPYRPISQQSMDPLKFITK